jgi:hypothetical protein
LENEEAASLTAPLAAKWGQKPYSAAIKKEKRQANRKLGKKEKEVKREEVNVKEGVKVEGEEVEDDGDYLDVDELAHKGRPDSIYSEDQYELG